MKIIFLDRDGTINIDTGYTHRIEDFQFEKNAVKGLKKLQKCDFQFIIATNQSGIARGHFTEDDFWKFNNHLVSELEKKDVRILKTYFSPFHPEKGIGKYKKETVCRKPGTGMVEKAFCDFDIEKENSWMIGDKWSDVKAGTDFGIKSILVRTCKGGSDQKHKTKIKYIAEDLLEAANYIINS